MSRQARPESFEGIILSVFRLLTNGLVAVYVLVGVVSPPTAYLLQRMATLNVFPVNIAALRWRAVYDGDGTWRWYYYDHEDSYWCSADCEIEGPDIYISSPGYRSIQVNTVTGECKVSYADGRIRTYGKSGRTDSPRLCFGTIIVGAAVMFHL